ncbi:unnamed protein product [Choristocarpus tenellus]
MERLEALVAELRKGGASGVCAVKMDVCDESSIMQGIAQAEKALGPINVLVNNAGVSVDKPALRQTKEDWNKVMSTNLVGPFLVARTVAKSMVHAKVGGSIINIASVAGLSASPALSGYCASKAGLVHLTRVLALEWARHGIRVNALCPGYFRTEMNKEFLDSDQASAGKVIKAVPMRRLGDLKDLDGLLMLLASDRASAYITGSILNVDGGLLASSL